MKHARHIRFTSWLLTLAMLCSWCISAAATDPWWTSYVDHPMEDWSIDTADGKVTSHGGYVLFTSDSHRYTYLVKDLLAAANGIIASDGAEGNVGLMSFGGDFANEKLLYDDNMSILKAALETSPGTVTAYTKGNHEGDVSDEDFAAATGMSRIGETAVNEDGLYHFFNFGAYNGTSQFLEEDIAALDAYLSSLEDNLPVFIVSHYPIHYYNDRRSAVNADKLVAVLNQYPQSVFLWGHNHTEQDPNYGMIRMPGDVIQTGASADTTVEIRFTYACLGALRDGSNGANGLLAKVDGTQVTFRYLDLNTSNSGDTWIDAQGNENSILVAGTPEISSTTTVDTAAAPSTITLANVQIDRPLVDHAPAGNAVEYSPKFTCGPLNWTANGAPVSGTFDFDTAYTVSFTLTAEDGYSFASGAVVSVNKTYVGPMPGQSNGQAAVTVGSDGKTAEVSFTFPATTSQGTAVDAATELVNGDQYVLAAIDQNIAAFYRYDPAQHGEESMPDYAVSAADVVIRNGQLVSATDSFMTFTAQKDAGGYLLYSDASLLDGQGATTLNYLGMSTRGGELGIQADEAAQASIYSNWYVTSEGLPYMNVDGAILYGAYDNGFTFVSDASACNLRLYPVGSDSSGKLYHACVEIPQPQPGQMPVETVTAEPYACRAGTVTWDTDGAFAYDTAYTATVTLTPADGFAFAESISGRVNGSAADSTERNADGTVTLRYTFDATECEPGVKAAVSAKKTDQIKDGGIYLIVADSQAMTLNFTSGIFLKAAPVTIEGDVITSDITTDMIFTASGDDETGYTLQCGNSYIAAKTVDNSPDTWGFTSVDDASGAITFGYDGKTMSVVSTGASGGPGGPGGPPPSSATSMLYMANGHFNYSSFAASEIELYEIVLNFQDVDPEQYYYEPMIWSVIRGYTNGMSDTEFYSDGTSTRAQIVTLLWRISGCPDSSLTEAPFQDLKEDQYYYDAVLWAYENGITNGMGNDMFEPDGQLTRSQMITLLYRFNGNPEASGSIPFTDVPADVYYTNAVQWGVENGIVVGMTATTFEPDLPCTRGHTVTFLYRTFSK